LVRRLKVDGDAQGDLAGHGGEHREVLVTMLLRFAKIPSSHSRPNAALLHLIAWLARPHFIFLQVGDFKGIRAG